MGDNLGPYELRGELGRGAMAVVWRGYDPTLDREVALKEPFLAPGTDPNVAAELAARFIREGRAAARLNHPGIVTIYGADTYDGRSAIAMELIEGQTLSDMLDRGPLPAHAAVSIIDQLLDAVGYAHAAGVVHRDIKPDNVFVTHDGRAKLADFGIAHVGTDASLTVAGSVMGTPGYMSPEQIAGASVDARSDLFSVGVMAHEMLTGRNPFGATEGAAATTVMYRIVHEPLPAIGQITPTGTDLDQVLAIATAKDPAYRFPDAATFRHALAGGAIGAMPAPGQASPYATGQYPAAAYASAPSKSRTWLPYAIVGGIGSLAIIGLLIAASGVGALGPAAGSGAAVPAATTAATVPAAGSTSAANPVESDLDHLINASSSPTLPSSKSATYAASNLLDGSGSTCWAEGVSGYGEGSWIRFDFREPVYLTRFGVIVGYDKNEGGWNRWPTNGRLREAVFQFADGSTVQHVFGDERGMQYVDFGTTKKTTSVTMQILATYPATYADGHDPADDTSLSEVNAMGWTAASVGE